MSDSMSSFFEQVKTHVKFFEQEANALAVPFCFAWHGLPLKSVSEDITALYFSPVKRSLVPFHAATLNAESTLQ